MRRPWQRAAHRSRLAIVLSFGACLSIACERRMEPQRESPAEASSARPAQLTTLAAGNLFDAYAGGGADAIYRGRRYTLVGGVVSINVDAGAAQLVLGSKLKPVIATGIDKGAAATLVPDAEIRIDCTVTGAEADIPSLDCGPNGVPRPVSPPP
jgi:hypothetical protein